MDTTRRVIRKMLHEQVDYREVVIQVDGGSAEGYVVSASAVNARNWLESEGVGELADELLPRYEDVAIFKNMYVPEEERGKGIGSQLLDDWIEDAFEDADAIFMVADLGESQAEGFDLVEFYRSRDFEVVADATSGPLMILDPAQQ